MSEALIRLRDVCTRFGDFTVHEHLDLDVQAGEILALVGGSGSGKTTLLHEMIMLRRPSAGSIRLFGEEVVGISPQRAQALRRRFGVLFQHGALFSGLTVLQNVGVPLREHTGLADDTIDALALIKIRMAGLPAEAAHRYPAELSGGMIKRAGLARAMAMDPQLLFLDEPTSGLDPHSADGFDALVRELKQWLGLTVVMISHDLDSLWNVADRVAVLGDRRIVAVAPMAELAGVDHPAVRQYFEGPRARRARRV
ncbi:ABC transporter ATP-binding protein [Thiohalobacter sp.]|uniref:ABC transporter ATP-binding protein n=1 Tax=Thiohalobacter sp. TaxID=2025948 RepID=UPI0026127AC5|nr:ATP-binding cassette domain-containing protein [Thiohalobacter sp.]